MFKYLVALLAGVCIVQAVSAKPTYDTIDLNEIIKKIIKLIDELEGKAPEIIAGIEEALELVRKGVQEIMDKLEEIKAKLINADPECVAKVEEMMEVMQKELQKIEQCGQEKLDVAQLIIADLVNEVLAEKEIVLSLYKEYQVCQAILPVGKEPSFIEEARYGMCVASLVPKVTAALKTAGIELSEKYDAVRDAVAKLTADLPTCYDEDVIINGMQNIVSQAQQCLQG